MTLIEITLALGLTMGILYSGTVQIQIQEQIWMEALRLEFYTRELPRISRALQSLSMQGQTFYVTEDASSTAGVEKGSAMVVTVRHPDGRTADKKNVIFFDPDKKKIKYTNSANQTWYLAKNIENAFFVMNPDATVTAFVDNGNGIVAEFVVERM